jgi:hypothetical protein
MRVALRRIEDSLGILLHTEGDLSLLERPRRMLMVSRVEKQISPRAPWLVALRHATDQLLQNQEVLVCGTHRVPYDLPLWITRCHDGCAIVVLLCKADPLVLDEKLFPKRRLLIWPSDTLTAFNDKEKLLLRDRLVGALANRATAIHIQSHGNMSKVAQEFKDRCISIDRPSILSTLSTPIPLSMSTPTESIRISTPLSRSSSTISVLKPQSNPEKDWPYLTHFTRDPDGQFPNETLGEYFHYLCSSSNTHPRNSLSSLWRILEEGRIRASSRLMPEHSKMVCLTELEPHQALELRRWRRGLRRWSFTPYGVAIRRDALAMQGAQAVQYLNKDETRNPFIPKNQNEKSLDRRFEQSASEGEFNWSSEKEWRISGDICLTCFSQEEVAIIVPSEIEANEIKKRYAYRIFIVQP